MSIFYLDPHEGTCFSFTRHFVSILAFNEWCAHADILNKLGELVDKKFFQMLVTLLLFVF